MAAARPGPRPIPDSTLDLAVAQGLIAPGQALALRSLARQQAEELRPEPIDEERLRFITGFADIFVTIGLVLFLGSAAYLAGQRISEGATAVLTAVLAWGLAEFFSRRHRTALPSIVLLLAFTSSVSLALSWYLVGSRAGVVNYLGWFDLASWPDQNPLLASLAAFLTAVATALHFWRFRVPITVAAGFAALALTGLLGLRAAAPALTEQHVDALLLAIGLLAFALAMRFDLADPARRTRRTDIAFWLHLLAAPLIVHSLFDMIGADSDVLRAGAATLVLAIFLVLALVAVVIDRRALLVSGLVYAGIAFSSLIRGVGLAGSAAPVTMLALGAFVLLLSAGWAPLRRTLLAALPEGWTGRLPERALG